MDKSPVSSGFGVLEMALPLFFELDIMGVRAEEVDGGRLKLEIYDEERRE